MIELTIIVGNPVQPLIAIGSILLCALVSFWAGTQWERLNNVRGTDTL